MEKGLIPTRPVIGSQTQATRELSVWLRENDYTHLVDVDGLTWQLTVEVNETPDKENRRKRTWDMAYKVSTSASAADFVRTGTLDAQQDVRLIELLQEHRVPLYLRPVRATAHSLEEARTVFANTVKSLHKRMSSQSLHDTKRHLIGKYVDDLFRWK